MMAITIKIPTPIPALKTPSTNSQLVNRTEMNNNRVALVTIDFIFSYLKLQLFCGVTNVKISIVVVLIEFL